MIHDPVEWECLEGRLIGSHGTSFERTMRFKQTWNPYVQLIQAHHLDWSNLNWIDNAWWVDWFVGIPCLIFTKTNSSFFVWCFLLIWYTCWIFKFAKEHLNVPGFFQLKRRRFNDGVSGKPSIVSGVHGTYLWPGLGSGHLGKETLGLQTTIWLKKGEMCVISWFVPHQIFWIFRIMMCFGWKEYERIMCIRRKVRTS